MKNKWGDEVWFNDVESNDVWWWWTDEVEEIGMVESDNEEDERKNNGNFKNKII